MSKFQKLKPAEISIDARFQRELNEARVRTMSKCPDKNRIGVPVVSQRPGGTYVVIDGQHRLAALKLKGLGDVPIVCEVRDGLRLEAEAMLFHDLNKHRKSVCKFDDFKSLVLGKDPEALEVTGVIEHAGLKITRSKQKNGVCAIAVVLYVHRHYQNLAKTLDVLRGWAEGNSDAYGGGFIKAIGYFLSQHPDVVVETLVEKLMVTLPQRLSVLIARERGTGGGTVAYELAADRVLMAIYTGKRRRSKAAA